MSVDEQIVVEDVPSLDAIEAEIAEWQERAAQDIELERAVRWLTLRLIEVHAETERVERLKDEVLSPYNAKLNQLGADEARVRQSIETILTRLDRKVNWPDLGTWSLRNNAAKLALVDEDVVAEAYALAQVALPTEVDWKAVKATLVERFTETGEIPPGCEVVPAFKSVAFRGAK